MKPYFSKTLKILDKLDVQYIIGADSLIGLKEGNLFKYSPNLYIYMEKLPIVRIITLFLMFLKEKIIFKIKKNKGKFEFKLRYKPSITSKDNTYIKIYLIEKLSENNMRVFIGNQYTEFLLDDIKSTKYNYEGVNLSIPKDLENFILKYKDALLSNFYKNYSFQFDSKSEQKVINFLYDVNKIISKSSLKFWIEGGTLLGAIRNQKLIPWDHDIDMGIINNSNKKIDNLIKLLRKKFYVSVKSFKKSDRTWNLGRYRVLKIYPKKYLFFKDNLCIDLFVYYLGRLHDADKKEVYKYVVWGRNAYHPRKFFDTLEKINFYGKKINVPSNPKEFLTNKYGKDWKTPKQKWNVALDDGSILKS